MKQAPWGTLTNDWGLSVHGWQPMAASWALLPDSCDSSRLMKHFRTGANDSSGIPNNSLQPHPNYGSSYYSTIMGLQGQNSLLLKNIDGGGTAGAARLARASVLAALIGALGASLPSYMILVQIFNPSELQAL